MQVGAGAQRDSAGRDGTGGRENWEGADTGRSWLGGLLLCLGNWPNDQ
jgi:hypothetical protein